MMNERVLFVDDEVNILEAFNRQLRNTFEFDTATGSRAGLDAIATKGPYAVVVSDLRMPEMDGVEFLARVHEVSPDTVRIMLSGNADLDAAIAAVNTGNIFRFLTKPCDMEALEGMVEAGVHQYDLVTSSRVLLEQTLSGSVQVLVDLLSVFDPKVFGQAQVMKDFALKVAERMSIPDPWNLGLAALLAPVGRMAIPLALQSKLNWGEQLTPQEKEFCKRIPETGARIVGNIPRLQPVARIILYAAKDFNGDGFPQDGVAGSDIPLESRVLRVLTDFLEGIRIRRSRAVVLEQLALTSGLYDPGVLAALRQVLENPEDSDSGPAQKRLPLRALTPGMCLMEDIFTPDGALVLAAGTRLALIHLERLRSVSSIARLDEPIRVEVMG